MTLRFKTSDGEIVEADPSAMRKSKTIADIITNSGGKAPSEILELEKIESNVLKAIIEYYEHYKHRPENEENQERFYRSLSDFDKNFLDKHVGRVFQLIEAHQILGIGSLLNICLAFVMYLPDEGTSKQVFGVYGLQDADGFT